MNGIVITLLPIVMAAFTRTAYGQENATNANNFLVNFTPEEALAVVECVAESNDSSVCEEYADCLSLMPEGIAEAYGRCRQEFTGSDRIECNPDGASLPGLTTRQQVFNCINENARQETEEDTSALERMEDCMREFYSEMCEEE